MYISITWVQAKELQSSTSQAFEEVNNIKIPYEIVDRRPGDIAECYVDAGKAERELGYKASRGIREMCFDSWRFEKGYKE